MSFNWASVGQSAAISGLSSGFADSRQAFYNRQAARDARSFADAMSSTEYQRSVLDMKRAGLNPAMMYQKGGGPSDAPGVAPASIGKGGGQSIEAVSAASLNSAQAGKIKEETRNVSAEADRNEVIAGVLKAIGPRIVQGIAGVESSAKAGGTALGKAEEIVRDVIESVISRTPELPKFKMPEAVREVEKIMDERSRTPSPSVPRFGAGVMQHNWGRSEYERAQDERMNRARQSPASRRRGGR